MIKAYSCLVLDSHFIITLVGFLTPFLVHGCCHPHCNGLSWSLIVLGAATSFSATLNLAFLLIVSYFGAINDQSFLA